MVGVDAGMICTSPPGRPREAADTKVTGGDPYFTISKRRPTQSSRGAVLTSSTGRPGEVALTKVTRGESYFRSTGRPRTAADAQVMRAVLMSPSGRPGEAAHTKITRGESYLRCCWTLCLALEISKKGERVQERGGAGWWKTHFEAAGLQ